MKPTIYIDPKGVVRYIPEWSGQPNAIEFVDQTQVISALNVHFGGECAVDTILPLPEGWRVEVKEELEYPIDHTSYPPYKKIAFLLP